MSFPGSAEGVEESGSGRHSFVSMPGPECLFVLFGNEGEGSLLCGFRNFRDFRGFRGFGGFVA